LCGTKYRHVKNARASARASVRASARASASLSALDVRAGMTKDDDNQKDTPQDATDASAQKPKEKKDEWRGALVPTYSMPLANLPNMLVHGQDYSKKWAN
jgi:hypothetical protein